MRNFGEPGRRCQRDADASKPNERTWWSMWNLGELGQRCRGEAEATMNAIAIGGRALTPLAGRGKPGGLA